MTEKIPTPVKDWLLKRGIVLSWIVPDGGVIPPDGVTWYSFCNNAETAPYHSWVLTDEQVDLLMNQLMDLCLWGKICPFGTPTMNCCLDCLAQELSGDPDATGTLVRDRRTIRKMCGKMDSYCQEREILLKVFSPREAKPREVRKETEIYDK